MLILCPTCKKKTTYDLSNRYRPFCAAVCKDYDFIAWADEAFKISRDFTEDDLEELGDQLDELGDHLEDKSH